MTSKTVNAIKNFVSEFLSKSGIHGFFYVGGALYVTIMFTLESWHRYLYASTVVAIERDHYYWNTSVPALTICPMKRLSEDRLDEYVKRKGIKDDEKQAFVDFIESLANSTYSNFDKIKNSTIADAVLQRLKIEPKHYLRLIYELTEDLTIKSGDIDNKVRNRNNQEFIRVTQILTEYGICYSTNNFFTYNLSTAYLLDNKMPIDDDFYLNVKLNNVRYGNLFDGEVTYSFIGFKTPISIFMHSPYETMSVARSVGYTQEAFEFETLSIEIITSKETRETFISQRGCRFHWESNLTHYKVYSKNLCISECRLELAYKHCKCIPHFYSNTAGKPVCNYKQLKTCFPQYKTLFLEFQDTDHGDEKVTCYCLQNCLDSNVIVENFKVLEGTKTLLGSSGSIMIMKRYPLVRFQREVIFTLTDFFVSIGGTAGFFIGCSVLSVIEIIYFFSLRFFWFFYGYRN
ncbi:hypothetical protein PVAND_010143 [Polypedilum vanderplanki]|uniref:Uncharacterized protein n=1 Tax=Polypedilum vanderplanki TaxID=319348 RepID=A0A9J6CEN2_POLVA|nr:hypothetical protein PVAND_010143 [Polypedilum vanderplanki]